MKVIIFVLVVAISLHQSHCSGDGNRQDAPLSNGLPNSGARKRVNEGASTSSGDGPSGGPKRINQGASTSTQQEQKKELEECEKCEIMGYVERLARLMTAEDRSGENLAQSTYRNTRALEAFHDEVFAYLLMTRLNSQTNEDRDPTRIQRRLRFFTYHFAYYMMRLVGESCSPHYSNRLFYEYDSSRNMILISEHVDFQMDTCLCGNYRERSILSTPFSVNFNFNSRLPQNYELDALNNNMVDRQVSAYQIIPLPLIARFFQTWLSDDSTNIAGSNFNRCVQTLYGRIRQSMRKLFIVSVMRSSSRPAGTLWEIDMSSEHAYTAILERARGWLLGNSFVGPYNRGPMNPRFQRLGDALFEGFDHDSRSIIGSTRYQQLRHLHVHMLDYVRNSRRTASPFMRLLNGLNVFFAMQLALYGYGMTPLDHRQWEYRYLTMTELQNIFPIDLRKTMSGQKYWAVKKPLSRRPRETAARRRPEEEIRNETRTMARAKRQWSDFVLDLLTLSMEANSRDDQLAWSCNFTRLHHEYSFGRPGPTEVQECEECVAFNEFTYDKISSSEAWRTCNGWEKRGPVKSWCKAWRRVMKYGDDPQSVDEPKLFGDKPRSETYLQDVQKVVEWYMTEINAVNQSKQESHEERLLTFRRDPIGSPKKGSTTDGVICYLTTIVAVAYTYHDCNKIFYSH